jgi:hypothetical protein
MRKTGWIVFLCLVVAVAAACSETSEDLDGYVPAGDTGWLDGYVPADSGADGTTPPAEYKYVKIEDLSSVSGAQDGADIDAVELQKTAGSSWAAAAESCTLPDGTACANPDQAVGASDAFCSDPTKCFSNYELPTDDPATLPPYVALGGFDGTTSGTLIVSMSEKIENGDTLFVYEVGNCDVSEACTVASTTKASPESVKVSVGTSATGPWVEVLAASDTTKHPDIEIPISGL